MYKNIKEEFNDGGIRFNNSRIILTILLIILTLILINKFK
jgi:hypothetical protein